MDAGWWNRRSCYKHRAHMQAGVISAFVFSFLVCAGCASTPQATTERDTEAKQFVSNPGSSTLYVYRTDFGDSESDSVLWIDGRLIGATLPRTFFRVNVDPGSHTLNGAGHDIGKVVLETRPGEIYFVSLSVSAGQSVFRLESAESARNALITCCVLLENWAPGQRPLLR
jgi:hypothetical protein